MHSKVINPRQHGRFVFHNRGSSSKTVTYLGHEAKAQQTTVHFFNGERNNIPSEEVRTLIDNNARGLRKNQEKFYSLVLSPSHPEIQHLQSDPRKLRAFTIKAMENYAANFAFKNHKAAHDKPLTATDLVWFATVHQERKEKQRLQKGKAKPGSHTHIHVLVSAQNKDRTLRLNPRSHQSRFSIRDWQVQNGTSFQQMFSYKQSTISKKLTEGMAPEQQLRHRQRIRDKVDYLNTYFAGNYKLDIDRVQAIGKDQHYGKGFFFRLHHLTQRYQQGKPINNPYRMLQTGKDEFLRFPERTLFNLAKGSQAAGHEVEGDEVSKRKKKQSRQLER